MELLKNNHTNRIMRSKHNEMNDIVPIYDGITIVSKKRSRWIAEAFISNPNNLRYAVLIDFNKTVCSLNNICWTNRPKYIKQIWKEKKDMVDINPDDKLFKILKSIIEKRRYGIIRLCYATMLKNEKAIKIWKNEKSLKKLYDRLNKKKYIPLVTTVHKNIIYVVSNLLINSHIDNFRIIESAMEEIDNIILYMEIKDKDFVEKYSKQYNLALAMSQSFHVDDLETVYEILKYFRVALNITKKDQCKLLTLDLSYGGKK